MKTGNQDPSSANRQRLLKDLLHTKPVSRVEVARSTGLSPATVNRLTGSLLESGLLREVGSDQATGGRPSLLVQFNPDARQILAVDITQDVIDVAHVNLAGEIGERSQQKVSDLSAGEKAIALRDLMETTIAADKAGSLIGVGVSVPGPVTDSGVVTMAPAVDWYDFPLAEFLSSHVKLPFIIENDVNLIAYGEYFKGSENQPQSLLAIGVFQGVGAGIVEHGRLWRGLGGAAGQFGRMLMEVSGLWEDRKGFGQVERRLGEEALRERARNAPVQFSDDATADPLFEAVDRGEPKAVALFNEAMDEYAFQVVNLSAILAPEVIVFDGLFGRWAHLVLPALRKRISGNVLQEPELRAAALGGDGKLVGAALYALDQGGGILALA